MRSDQYPSSHTQILPVDQYTELLLEDCIHCLLSEEKKYLANLFFLFDKKKNYINCIDMYVADTSIFNSVAIIYYVYCYARTKILYFMYHTHMQHTNMYGLHSS